eukprot:6491714-Amphidinium_carterae.1
MAATYGFFTPEWGNLFRKYSAIHALSQNQAPQDANGDFTKVCKNEYVTTISTCSSSNSSGDRYLFESCMQGLCHRVVTPAVWVSPELKVWLLSDSELALSWSTLSHCETLYTMSRLSEHRCLSLEMVQSLMSVKGEDQRNFGASNPRTLC